MTYVSLLNDQSDEKLEGGDVSKETNNLYYGMYV